jgi:RNA polymerase sigma-70 factor (ECF subfamily)
MTDEQALEQSIQEPECFGLLFDRHFDEIARFCIRRLGAVRGEDVAGDVFRWAFENRGRFDAERGAVHLWLFRVANNHVRNAARSAGRQGLAYSRWLIREGDDYAELSGQVAAAVDAEHDLCAVAAVLELQPADEVETLLLFAWEELSYAEVAEVLAIPIGTVRSRISRVRRHLHDVLDDPLHTSPCSTNSIGGVR